jgi:hypothetical protein
MVVRHCDATIIFLDVHCIPWEFCWIGFPSVVCVASIWTTLRVWFPSKENTERIQISVKSSIVPNDNQKHRIQVVHKIRVFQADGRTDGSTILNHRHLGRRYDTRGCLNCRSQTVAKGKNRHLLAPLVGGAGTMSCTLTLLRAAIVLVAFWLKCTISDICCCSPRSGLCLF